MKLYHPVLPYKSYSKLKFLLSTYRANTMNQGICTHSDERCIVGTWEMDEFRKAIVIGYILVNVFEFWEYIVTCFDKGGSFAEYVNIFLKLKKEPSGYPIWV